MLKNRIIPCLDVKNGRVVKGGDDNLSDLVLVPIKEIALACLNRL